MKEKTRILIGLIIKAFVIWTVFMLLLFCILLFVR